ncbi:muconolactone Delta-isomerase family protein [Streptomyces sp. NBC_01754]|uniref:muconolactone Delta-isomerase n=1 Tax=Streptomyces sp. NBC_01754 TaxID=2975930 RepID=UPI002DDA9CA2|nr:muconolactone Delta-isomerase family protein [Streptomyces sp. NBC_01754]WSC96386.1 muconolactone Delta-isomerase family protein [Streptomyces sp. NBC_01754]
MEWLVHTENQIPAETSTAERDRIRVAERARAMELRAQGVLKRLWRTPGRHGTVGLYECRDATHLHDTLASLPMFPWLEVTVEALATHPQEMVTGDGRTTTGQTCGTDGTVHDNVTEDPTPDLAGGRSEGHDEQPV